MKTNPLSPTLVVRISSAIFYLCVFGIGVAIVAIVADAVPVAFDIFDFG